ncbi:MAG: Arc family DNA-binding protein [Chitinophagales bacterium]|jgi:hypothetical protein
MAEKKNFVLRIDDEIYKALEKWAADEFRSVNGQIESLIYQQLKEAGRLKGVRSEEQTKSGKSRKS